MAEVAAYVVANAATITAVAAATAAAASISSANAQSQQMRIQAQQAELQGRQGALQYSNQATQVLERQQQLAAAVRARAASGGVDPFTGSPMTIQQVDAMKAGEEYGMAKDNAQSAIYGGLAQSQSLQSAASTTKRIGYLTAIGDLATAGASYGATKTPKTD